MLQGGKVIGSQVVRVTERTAPNGKTVWVGDTYRVALPPGVYDLQTTEPSGSSVAVRIRAGETTTVRNDGPICS